jgi:hypothetical protein
VEVEGDEGVDVGVGVEDPGEFLLDEPGEVEIGIGAFEKLEGSGGVDHVAQGRKADEGDPFPVPAHRTTSPATTDTDTITNTITTTNTNTAASSGYAFFRNSVLR